MNGQTNSKDIAIKVSWKRSRDSVENECSILKEMEKYKVPHVEKCLSRSNNPYPFAEGRVMIALIPVISSDGITSSINNVKSGQPQRNAIKSTVETMIGMLKAGIYTLDIQPLMNIETGETTFIDFTEAKQLSSLSDEDESALVGFCSEMFVLIPDSLKEVAEDYLRTELDLLKNSESTLLPENIQDIVESIWLD